MKTLTTTALFVLSSFTSQVLAVCPGFTLAIGNVIPNGRTNQWNVYDNNCKVVDGLTLGAKQNPCDQHIFGCSPNPVLFVNYTSTPSGARYTCRQAPNSGNCGNDIISVCCLPVGASSTTTTLPPATTSATSTNGESTSSSHQSIISTQPSSTSSTSSNHSTTSSSSVSSTTTSSQAYTSTPPNIAGQTLSSPPLNTTSSAVTTNESSALSAGAIAGLSVGAVVAVILFVVLLLLCYKERQRTRNRQIVFPGPVLGTNNYPGDPRQPRFETFSPSFQAPYHPHQISTASYQLAWQGRGAPVPPTLLSTTSRRSTSVWTYSDEKSQISSSTSDRTSTDAGYLPYLLPSPTDKLPPPYNNQRSGAGTDYKV